MPAAQPAARPSSSTKFKLDRSTVGDITQLTLHGVLDENFEGKKVVESIRSKKLVLNLRDVRRFASWGMSEWMNFLRALPDTDLYLVECSTYAVNQINLVTGLLGHGKLVSFYAPFRCGTCDAEFETLILVPLDRTEIRNLADNEQVCPTCGGKARMEKYPSVMCEAILEKPAFDIEDDVVAYLRQQYKYALTPDVTRFRAQRKVHGDFTYLRLSGSLGRLPPEVLSRAVSGTTVLDLVRTVFVPGELEPWRQFIQLARNNGTLQLLDCPVGFLEHAVELEDLQWLKVRSFALAYHCPTCQTTTAGVVDVAPILEQLVDGTIPNAKCPTCNMVLVATTGADEAALIRHLPAREHDVALEEFVGKAVAEAPNKLEDALALKPAKAAAAAAPRSNRVLLLTLTLAAVLVAGLAVIAIVLFKGKDAAPTKQGVVEPPVVPPKPTFQRPDWITSDLPASAFCHDMINRLMCIGVSSYRKDRNEAVAEANDAALEEIVNTIGLKISNQYFKDEVLAGYTDARSKALSALQALDMDRTTPAYAAANEVVRKARKRVVDAFKLSGGPAVPAQRTDWYWEEYAIEKGSGTENLVFIRYDVTIDALKALVEKYSATVPVGGSTAMTAFPLLGWQYDDFTGGAILTKVGRPFAAAKIAPRSVVMQINDVRISDAPVLAKTLDEVQKAPSFTASVRAPDAKAATVEIKR